jgi:tetratricopeptide (TPR) repeat protein
MRSVCTFIFVLLQLAFLRAQELTTQLRQREAAHLAHEKFGDNLYGEAAFQAGIHQKQNAIIPDLSNKDRITTSGLTEIIALLRMETPESELKALDFISSMAPDPAVHPVVAALGSFYYNKRRYKKAIEVYQWGDADQLPAFDKAEFYFKLGYAQFVTKDFQNAQKNLEKAKQTGAAYYEASIYYSGLCEYFLGRYTAAIAGLQKVKTYKEYAPYVPYYLIQMYFTQHEYDKVIEEGESAIQNENLTNRKEIRQLTGQAYFRKNIFDKALPHLEYYEKNTQQLTFEEFYQLGMAHYRLGNYDKAAGYFRELQQTEGKRGQQVHYLLADCYYKTGDYVSARSAFRRVSQMNFDNQLQEEALLNYGKLSAQTGLDREAILSLKKINPSSVHHKEAEELIISLLNQMEDTGTALQMLEEMKPLSATMIPLFHRLTLRMALQHIRNEENSKAMVMLQKLTESSVKDSIRCQAYFWLANEDHTQGKFESSAGLLDQYFSLQPEMHKLPAESSEWAAWYLQGYNYYNLKNFTKATDLFIRTANTKSIRNASPELIAKHEAIVNDAIIRAGDGFFARNQYKDALKWYNQLIQNNSGAVDYALYQKAIILGLNDEPYEKIVTLDILIKKHKASMWADDAWMTLGDTYQQVDNTENAFSSYKTLTEIHGNSPYTAEAYTKMALIAFNKGDLEQAATFYKNVFKHKPSPTLAESALLGLEEIYIKDLGRSEDYVAFVNTIPGYKLSESISDSLYFMVGAIKFNEAAYEKAVIAFSTYLEKFPKGIRILDAHYYKAESNTLLKQYKPALEGYEAVLKQGSSGFYLPSLKKAGIIAFNYVQDFEKAYTYSSQYYDSIADSNEKYRAAMNALRSAFKNANGSGVKKFAPIVSMSDQAGAEDRSQAQYYLGKILLKEENYNAAIVAFTAASEKAKNAQAAESRYQIAYIYFKTGAFEQAESQCHQANELNSAYPAWIARTLLLLSDIYIVKKDYLNARAAVEAIIENFNSDQEILRQANENLEKIKKLEFSANRMEQSDSDTLKLQVKKEKLNR